MRRFGAVMAALAATLALTAGSALAIPVAGTLDQQQTDTSAGYWMNLNQYRAQTFTAGITGALEGVTIDTQVGELNAAVPAAAGDYSIEIWATSGGVPSGASALASQTVVGDVGGQVLIVFSSPPSVVAGTMYALRMVVDAGGEINWLGNCQTDAYAGGRALVYDVTGAATWQTVAEWANDNEARACALDYAFATYVTAASVTAPPNATPPPTAAAQAPAGENRGSAMPLLLVTLAIAASALTVKRLATTGR